MPCFVAYVHSASVYFEIVVIGAENTASDAVQRPVVTSVEFVPVDHAAETLCSVPKPQEWKMASIVVEHEVAADVEALASAFVSVVAVVVVAEEMEYSLCLC